MVEYFDAMIARSGISPIMLGYLGALCILAFINNLRGK
jgi:hypothetical protein